MAESSLKQRIQLVGADEVRRSFQEIGKAGEDAFARIEQASQSVKFDKTLTKNLDAAKASLQRIKDVSRATFAEVGDAAAATLARNVAGSGAAFGGFGEAIAGVGASLMRLAGPTGAILTAAAGMGILAKRSLDATAELAKTAKELDISVQSLSAFRKAADVAGVSQKDLTAGLEGFAGKVKEAYGTTRAFGGIGESVKKGIGTGFGEAASAVRVFSDETGNAEIRVRRFGEGVKPLNDFQKTLDALRLSITDVADETGNLRPQGLVEIAKAFERLNLTDPQKVVAAKSLGLSQFIDVLRQDSATVQRLVDKGLANAPSQQALDAAKQYEDALKRQREAVSDLSDAVDRFARVFAIAFGPTFVFAIDTAAATINALAKTIEATLNLLTKFKDAWDNFGPNMRNDQGTIDRLRPVNPSIEAFPTPQPGAWDDYESRGTQAVQTIRAAVIELGTTIDQSISGAFRAVEGSAQSAASSIQQAAASMNAALQSVIQTASAATYAVSGDTGTVRAATGGYITGPGTSTSDSIPARLSSGEFVMRAASVRRYGVDLMHALNGMRVNLPSISDGIKGFAMGGLVQPVAMPALAGAGMAAGHPVILNIGGESFTATAAPDVAERLARYAAKRMTASAGRRPSWVGG